MRRAILVSSLVTLIVALSSCATGPDPKVGSADPRSFQLHSDARSISAQAVGTPAQGGLSGPQLQVSWNERRLQGNAFGAPVNLSLEGDRVSGVIGELPVRLHVQQDGDRVSARGLFGGRISHLRVDDEGLNGTIGLCSYDLDAQNGVYQGWRSCRRTGNEPVWVRVPTELAGLSTPQRVAALSLLLGSG